MTVQYSNSERMTRPQLLLLGDSITELGADWEAEGWVCLLLRRYNRTADFILRGMGGYSTEWFTELVLPTLETDLGSVLHPALITVWLGANDAALLDGPSGDQHVPLDTYKNNLHVMVALFKSRAPQANVLLITPPPVNEKVRRQANHGALDRSNAAAGEYANACVQVAEETGVESLDLFLTLNALPAAEWQALLSDGLHLSKAGNRFVEQQLVDTIAAKFPDLHNQLQHLEFPSWVPFSAPSRPGPQTL